MTRSETEAPNGKQRACVVSSVAKPESTPRKPFKNKMRIFMETVLTRLVINRLARQQVVGAFALPLLFLLARLLLHVEGAKASVHNQQD